MKTPAIAAAAIVLLGVVASSRALSFKDGTTTFTAGNWSVQRVRTRMPNQDHCFALYKRDREIQLSQDRLLVAIKGGIQAVTLTFGENPPQDMRLARRAEKNLSAVLLEGAEFRQALETTRLRVQVLVFRPGYDSKHVDLDLDTSGLGAAVDHMRVGCLTRAADSTRTDMSTEVDCPEPLLARLRAAGFTESQISTACRP